MHKQIALLKYDVALWRIGFATGGSHLGFRRSRNIVGPYSGSESSIGIERDQWAIHEIESASIEGALQHPNKAAALRSRYLIGRFVPKYNFTRG